MLMKKLSLIFLLITSIAQAQNICKNPMSAQEFNHQFELLSRMQNDKDQMMLCKNLLRDNCFSTNQVKLIAIIFNKEEPRLNFCMKAFERTVDKENYYEVFDALKLYSSVFKLHDFITGVVPNTNAELTGNYLNDPKITYPICDNYKGLKGCGLPLADNDFNVFTMNFTLPNNEAERQQAAIDFVNKNCVSMAQAMKLSMTLQLESSRLFFLKQVLAKIYDQENYTYAAAVFSNAPYKKDWIDFASGKLTPPLPPPAPVVICEVKAADFEQVKKSINNESSSSVKLSLTKQILSAKKCFKCFQIKEIIGLMSFESGKLEIAKFAYDYAIDKENYYTVAEALSFSSSKEELMDFIKTKK